MKVLLIKDVQGLGKVGEVKEVKDGYGKNFLIGKGFAKHATQEVLARHAASVRKHQEDEQKELERLKMISTQLEKLKIDIVKKIGKNNHLFGAVTKDEITQALKLQHDIEIDKKHIVSKENIKSIGEHNIDLKLGHGLKATLHVNVLGE